MTPVFAIPTEEKLLILHRMWSLDNLQSHPWTICSPHCHTIWNQVCGISNTGWHCQALWKL